MYEPETIYAIVLHFSEGKACLPMTLEYEWDIVL